MIEKKKEEIFQRRYQIIAEKSEELKQEEVYKRQIVFPEPSLREIVYETVTKVSSKTVSKIINILKLPFYSLYRQHNTQSISALELTKMYDQVEVSVYEQMPKIVEEVDIGLFNKFAEEAITELNQEAIDALKFINLRIYFTSICQIKRPKYVFNENTGELYIHDPISSRTHLIILAKNVVSFYDHVRNTIDDSSRLTNILSLFQKSQILIETLTSYDTELINTILQDYESAPNEEQFFENIIFMWNNIKNQIRESLVQFPMDERYSRLASDRKKEEIKRRLFEETITHELKIQKRVQTLTQKQQLNNFTLEEWKTFNQWFSIQTHGVLQLGTSVVNNVMNSTTDVGNNAINNVKKLVDTGIYSFVTILWLIVIVSISLTILMITSLSIYSKYITNITNNTKYKLKQEQQQQSSS